MAFIPTFRSWLSPGLHSPRLHPRRPQSCFSQKCRQRDLTCKADVSGSGEQPPGDVVDNLPNGDIYTTDAAVTSQRNLSVKKENDRYLDEILQNSEGTEENEVSDVDECFSQLLYSPSLAEHVEERRKGLIPRSIITEADYSDAWALSVQERNAFEMKNQYSRIGIKIEHNFCDFEPPEECREAHKNATIEEIVLFKAHAVYEGTGLPCIAEMCDMSIDPPESGSRINKSLQQGYYTRDIETEADIMLDRVRPISDENRMTRFNSVAAYYDGENEVITNKRVNVAMAFCTAVKATIATAGALDDLYIELSKKFGLTFLTSDQMSSQSNVSKAGKKGKVMIGATLLRERILREGKILGDGIIKVSSFLNHMVDTDLIEVCGEELAERLRKTMPNKVLTVESTGLIAGLPTARRLGIPLVFARKSRPITISDSYQTTYRSLTKGVTSELIVSCEYLEDGDRVLIIDDFLAGGSTAEALFKLAKMAHAKVVGVGVLIEKLSDGGRTFLSGFDVPVESLAKVSADSIKGRVSVVEEEPWVSPDHQMGEDRVREEAMRAKNEYYSRTDDNSLTVHEESRHNEEDVESTHFSNDFDVDGISDGDGEVDIIRWEDEDMLDDIEEELVREGER